MTNPMTDTHPAHTLFYTRAICGGPGRDRGGGIAGIDRSTRERDRPGVRRHKPKRIRP